MSNATEQAAVRILGLQMEIMELRLMQMKKEMQDPDGYVGNIAADLQACNTFMKQNKISVTEDDAQLSSLQKMLVSDGIKTLDDFDVTLDIHKN